MGIFKKNKTLEEKAKEQEIEIKLKTETLNNISKGREIELFPGSLEEYERLKGRAYEIIDTDRDEKYIEIPHKDILFSEDSNTALDWEEIGKLGADAAIRYVLLPTLDCGYGIPVKAKKEK